ncbi:MAG: hypothetical protein OEM02_08150 [Desulfobulbaceae bacterium]|nr:hypothetical protein [Desulfobulbaceae bacterium]
MNINPELQRYTWLEISISRLLGMVWVLGFVFYLTHMADVKFGEDITSKFAIGFYCLLTMLWGTRLASESVFSEIRDHTWDFQRMSSLGPWSLAWGKLIGSTIYTWYGALICLIVFTVCASDGVFEGFGFWKVIIFIITVGLISQCIGLFAALLSICKNRNVNTSSTSAIFIIGGVLGLSFLSMGWENMEEMYYFTWYGIPFDSGRFILGSSLMFLGWLLIGIYRLLCAELQVKITPVVWCSFVLFLMIYFAGFLDDSNNFGLNNIKDRFYVAFMVGIVSTYTALLINKKDPVAFGKLLYALRGRDLRAILFATPPWLTSLGLVSFSCFVGLLLPGNGFEGHVFNPIISNSSDNVLVMGIFLFLLRDTGLLIYFNLAKKNRRADMLFVLNLCFLYGLLPILATMLNLDRLTVAFWPMTNHPMFLVVITISAQILLVGWLVIHRWQQYHDLA